MAAIVLAGGKHSLISEFYADLPTCLIHVAGKPFIHWLNQWLKLQGFTHIIYSISHKDEKIDAWIEQASEQEPNLCLDTIRETRPLGTGGATLKCAKRFPNELSLIVNSDSLMLIDLKPALKQLHADPNLDGIIVGTHMENAGRFANLEIDDMGRLLCFKAKQAGKGLVNAGIYLLKKSLIDNTEMVKEELSLEYDSFPNWLAQGKRIQVITSQQPFIDIGTPCALNRAHALIQHHLYPLLLEN
jgi:D-glycero-alpha-D-manno-heptose 1-phosphate guanylyltransferase